MHNTVPCTSTRTCTSMYGGSSVFLRSLCLAHFFGIMHGLIFYGIVPDLPQIFFEIMTCLYFSGIVHVESLSNSEIVTDSLFLFRNYALPISENMPGVSLRSYSGIVPTAPCFVIIPIARIVFPVP